ncbi:MAG: 3-phosphoshikimate 1-carboxyvinyltransferase [Candidatus Omnitrophica bacterium]|nr:3-phosphoshikimate 1-carboxyvinyltransferase [Candidatus Omnitrophota bacterium]
MFKIEPLRSIRKTIKIPGDKSISHRALMLSSIAVGRTRIKSLLRCDDTLATLNCLKNLGLEVKEEKNGNITIKGNGLYFKKKSPVYIDACESGTTIRILSGLLVGQRFPVCLNAAPSLRRRPMSRIITPLRQMGADIKGSFFYGKSKGDSTYAPLVIQPVKTLSGIEYQMPVASAQLKSALLLAGLYAKGKTTVIEPFTSRDHTERMLRLFGADLEISGNSLSITSSGLSSPEEITIPGDFSSAAFLIVLGLITVQSSLVLKNININPSRCGLLNVLKRMGAKIEILNKNAGFEPYADIKIESSSLKATSVKADEIPLLIDEIPILCVAAAFAKGKTEIEGVKELYIKESNRVKALLDNLIPCGVEIEEINSKKNNSKIIIKGSGNFRPIDFKSCADHRIAMSMIVFALALGSSSRIDDINCIDKSFPDFIKTIRSLYLKNEDNTF